MVRASNCVIFMINKDGGANYSCNTLADNQSNTLNAAVDNLNVKISDFKLLLKYVEPNNMIKQALNKTMTQEEAPKYYITQYHTVTKNHQDNDIFTGSTPYRLFVLVCQHNFNGDANHNAL